jgi:hypothetical protein
MLRATALALTLLFVSPSFSATAPASTPAIPPGAEGASAVLETSPRHGE